MMAIIIWIYQIKMNVLYPLASPKLKNPMIYPIAWPRTVHSFIFVIFPKRQPISSNNLAAKNQIPI